MYFSHFCLTLSVKNVHEDIAGSLREKTTRFLFWKVPDRLEISTSVWLHSIYGWSGLVYTLRTGVLHLMISIIGFLSSSLNCWQTSPLQVASCLNIPFFFPFFFPLYDTFLLNFNSAGIKIMICMFLLCHSRNCMVWLSIFTLVFGYLPLTSSWLSSVPERHVCNLSKSDLVKNKFSYVEQK